MYLILGTGEFWKLQHFLAPISNLIKELRLALLYGNRLLLYVQVSISLLVNLPCNSSIYELNNL